MASSITTFAFAIKDRYDKVEHVENLTLADRPLLAMLKKDTDFAGDGTHVPLIYGNPQGMAAVTVAQSQTSALASGGNVTGKKFILTAGDYHGSVSIGDKVIQASRSNPGAFLKNKAQEMDGLFEGMSDALAHYCYGNGGNTIGTVATGGVSVGTGINGGDVLTLTEATDTINFEVGMLIDSSATDGTTGSGTLTQTDNEVQAVNRIEGTIDVGTSATSIVATEYLFRTGDYGDLSGVFIFPGLSAFLWSDNTPPNLYSMVRTDDPQRLAGSRVPSAALAGRNIEERLQILGSYMTGRFKGKGASHGFMNPEDFTTLSIALQSRGRGMVKDKSTRFGFEYISVFMGNKDVKIYSDPFCPKGTFFALRLKDWTLHSMEKLIHPIEADGLTLLRGSSANTYEFRLVSYPALCCVAPGYSGRVAL